MIIADLFNSTQLLNLHMGHSKDQDCNICKLHCLIYDMHYVTMNCRQWNQRSDFVGDNSLICDCWSVWLRKWLLTTDHAYSSVTCASPENVRGLDIRSAGFGTNCCERLFFLYLPQLIYRSCVSMITTFVNPYDTLRVILITLLTCLPVSTQ